MRYFVHNSERVNILRHVRERIIIFSIHFVFLFFFPYFPFAGISILYRKPTKTPPSLFSFLSPFSAEVWWYLIGSYIFVSVVLFIIGRICPAEWNNPYPCIEEPEELENQFTFKNSLWFTIGSIMQQGSEIAPMYVKFPKSLLLRFFATLATCNSTISTQGFCNRTEDFRRE